METKEAVVVTIAVDELFTCMPHAGIDKDIYVCLICEGAEIYGEFLLSENCLDHLASEHGAIVEGGAA